MTTKLNSNRQTFKASYKKGRKQEEEKKKKLELELKIKQVHLKASSQHSTGHQGEEREMWIKARVWI